MDDQSVLDKNWRAEILFLVETIDPMSLCPQQYNYNRAKSLELKNKGKLLEMESIASLASAFILWCDENGVCLQIFHPSESWNLIRRNLSTWIVKDEHTQEHYLSISVHITVAVKHIN